MLVEQMIKAVDVSKKFYKVVYHRRLKELAELVEWAFSISLEVLAHLGLEFLLQGVELALGTVEIVIVARLLKMSHDLSWWVVEISFLSVWS